MPGSPGLAHEGDDDPAMVGYGALRATVLEGHSHHMQARRHLSVFDPEASDSLAVREPGIAGAERNRSTAAGNAVVGDRPAGQVHADDIGITERGLDAAALRPVEAARRPQQHQSAGRANATDVAWGSDERRSGPYPEDLTDVRAETRVGRRSQRARDRVAGVAPSATPTTATSIQKSRRELTRRVDDAADDEEEAHDRERTDGEPRGILAQPDVEARGRLRRPGGSHEVAHERDFDEREHDHVEAEDEGDRRGEALVQLGDVLERDQGEEAREEIEHDPGDERERRASLEHLLDAPGIGCRALDGGRVAERRRIRIATTIAIDPTAICAAGSNESLDVDTRAVPWSA